MKKQKKDKWVYIVSCNKEPIIYGVYFNCREAVKYAESLVLYRRPEGFYHYENLERTWRKQARQTEFKDAMVFSACLRNPERTSADDGCLVTVNAHRVTIKHRGENNDC